MAEKLDKQAAAPVSVENKQQQPSAARPPFLHIDDVQLVNLCMFLNALAVPIFFFAVGVAYHTLISSSPAPATTPSHAHAATEMTEETLALYVLVIGMLWLSTPQAATAALALLLPCHRWRWSVVRQAAAYAALVITVASHCLYAAAVLVFVRAYPGDHLFKFLSYAAILIIAVLDLLAFLVLLLGEWAN